MQQANNTLIKNATTHMGGEDCELYINLADKNLFVNNCKVDSITMCVTVDNGEVYAGDLAVNWQAVDDSNYNDGNSTLLMRNVHDDNTNTQTMGAFYWEHEFDDALKSILLENGFSANAVDDVCGSEWGMQDVGRASYDAYCIAEEMLNAWDLKIAA